MKWRAIQWKRQTITILLVLAGSPIFGGCQSGSEPQVIRQKDGRSVLLLENREIPITEGLAGYVEHVERSDGNRAAVFSGWAIDEVATRPAERVVVVSGSRLLTTGKPEVKREDVAKLNPRFLESGFRMQYRGAEPLDGVKVRVFAVLSNGTARELRYSDGYPF